MIDNIMTDDDYWDDNRIKKCRICGKPNSECDCDGRDE